MKIVSFFSLSLNLPPFLLTIFARVDEGMSWILGLSAGIYFTISYVCKHFYFFHLNKNEDETKVDENFSRFFLFSKGGRRMQQSHYPWTFTTVFNTNNFFLSFSFQSFVSKSYTFKLKKGKKKCTKRKEKQFKKYFNQKRKRNKKQEQKYH